MLDDFGNELESTESKLDTTMKKVAKVLHMNNGKYFYCFAARATSSNEKINYAFMFADSRQWTAIIVLSIMLVLLIVLFIVL